MFQLVESLCVSGLVCLDSLIGQLKLLLNYVISLELSIVLFFENSQLPLKL